MSSQFAKPVIALASLVLCAALLAACGGDDDSQQPASAPAGAEGLPGDPSATDGESGQGTDGAGGAYGGDAGAGPGSAEQGAGGTAGSAAGEAAYLDSLDSAAREIADACREVALEIPDRAERRRDGVLAACEQAAAIGEDALRAAAIDACEVYGRVAVGARLRDRVTRFCREAIP